tara:strand:- start:3790 stop:4215 length:426 start_codon:yes stop_codon:yes gene_type:complete
MNIESVAKELNNTEYPLRISKEKREELKAAGIVIIFGSSDDLVSFVGAIYDEVDAYNGTDILLGKNGIVFDRESLEIDTDEELEEWLNNKKSAKLIKAIWNNGEYSWILETEIPHETFDILENVKTGEKNCKALVINLNNL